MNIFTAFIAAKVLEFVDLLLFYFLQCFLHIACVTYKSCFPSLLRNKTQIADV